MIKPLNVGEVVISLDNTSVSYRRGSKAFSFRKNMSKVLDGVTLDISHGDSLGVIGGNGAGKSTLLKLLGGLIKPDSGVMEQYVNTVSLLSIQAGFVPHLTGRDNAILSGLLIGMSRKEMAEQIEAIKEFSGLGEYFEEIVSCYSAGMRSRLGFSTSINIDPDVLLIDEILAVGDADFKMKSQKIIQDRIDADKTIVIVSHSTDLIRKSCNRAIWLDHGKLMKQGDVDEVISAYESK